MKKVPKIVQCDKRGQIVIPKEVRRELGIDESTAFWAYSISGEGILLKKVDSPEIQNDNIANILKEKSEKINLDKDKIDKSLEDYRKTESGGLELI